MKYRICPVCDQKMKTAHYCSNCRAWVKNPWVREVDYYLNERHPTWEADCSYHGSGKGRNDASGQNRSKAAGQSRSGTAVQSHSGTAGQGRNRTAVPNQPRTYGQSAGTGTASYGGASGSTPGTSGARYAAAAGKTAGKPGTYTHVAGGSYGAPQVPKATADPKRLIIIAAVIFFAINIVFSIVHTIYKLDHPSDRKTPETYEYDMDLGCYDASGDEYWYEDISDEEARSEGTACSGMYHFEITGEQMEEVLRGVMEEYGYDFTGVDRWTENGRNSDELTWYESTTVISLQTEHETAEPYIEINCDTVTGQLHWLEIYLEDKAHTTAFIKAALAAMDQEQELVPDEDIVELFEADVVPLIEKTEGFYYILGEAEICGSRYDEVYSVSIWPSRWTD